ncbi:MAG TPA: hypothetical protein VLL52_21545 [Anaerolineae bacterium]|nr:hypothetical protein [Anaerolineae bacterium]
MVDGVDLWLCLSVALAGGHYLIGASVDDEVGVDGGAAYWFQPGVQTTVTYMYDPLYRVVGAVYTGSVDAEFDYLVEMVGNMIETINTYEPYGDLLHQTGSSLIRGRD